MKQADELDALAAEMRETGATWIKANEGSYFGDTLIAAARRIEAQARTLREQAGEPIETDDQVEYVARECGWDNRRYMTPKDYAIWCARMREFVQRANPDTALRAENERLRNAIAKQNHDIEQTLGQALGYPWFKDDQKNFPGATEANGVCVGEHVAETLATEAASKIESLRVRLADAERDAARYRWLRDNLNPSFDAAFFSESATDFDAAIDAAIAQPDDKGTG